MSGLAGRLLRVSAAEAGLAASLSLIMVLTSVGQGAGATAMDALLFARFGTERLPLLYLALGVVSIVCALGVSVLFAAVRRDRAYPAVLAVLALALVALYLFVRTDDALAYPVAWLGANVVVMFQGIVAWGVASWLCDARQAKRLFPLANAAKIGGVIVGSALVAPLVAVLRLDDLLLLWALALAGTLAVVWRVSRTAPSAPAIHRDVSLARELVSGFGVVRSSRLLRLLAASLVLFSVLFFALALPFTRAARDAFPREEDLAAFLGLFNASVTAVAVLVSLVVANRIYARIGVVNAILVFTLIYLAGFVALVATGSFLVVAAARWLQLAWLAGIADSAYQALFNPVPSERRDQMRAFMEGVPGQAGIALAGILLVLGDRTLAPAQVAIGGAAVAALTTWVIWRIRAAYRDALVDALRAGRPEPFLGAHEAYAGLLRDGAAIRVVRDALAAPDVPARRIAARILAERPSPELADTVRVAAGDADAVVRAHALRAAARLDPLGAADAARASLDRGGPDRASALLVLHRAGDAAASDLLRGELAAADADARLAALEAVADSVLFDRLDLLAAATDDRDLAVRRRSLELLAAADERRAMDVALGWLAVPGRAADALTALEDLPAAMASPDLARSADDAMARASRYRRLARAFGADGDVAGLVRLSLENRARAAARAAVRAAAIRSGRRAGDALLDGLESGDSRRRAEALEALETCVRRDLAGPLIALWEREDAPPARSDATAALRDDDDEWLRTCAAQLDGGVTMAAVETVPLMERVLFLHRVPLFARLDPADLQQIARIATEVSFGEGDTIARQGEEGDALYVVLTGAVTVRQGGSVVATRGAGDAVGEMSIVSAVPRIATLAASGPTRALRLARADFEAILRDRPETALGVIRVLSARLAEATARSA